MHHHTRRLLPSTIIAGAALTAAAVLAPAAASAQADPAAVATATSTAADGLKYIALNNANNDLRVRLSGTTFTVDDIVPIQAGTGCAPVIGDSTKVTCTAFKEGTGPAARFKEFFVNLGAGNDTVINQTNSGATGAPMLALGGTGDDTLIGGDGVHDELRGSSGNDTLRSGNETSTTPRDVLSGGFGDDKLFGGRGSEDMDGGPGADALDGGDDSDALDGGTGTDTIDGGLANSGGFFSEDIVVYDRVNPVHVDLRRTDASQGTQANPSQGIPAEGDTILRVENARGGDGNDWITGNELNNNLLGGPGNDTLDGQQGLDRLQGDDGNDVLVPSFNADGFSDILDCDGFGGDDDDDPNDLAFRFHADGDFVKDCEQVIDL